jgi:hypothetical protein
LANDDKNKNDLKMNESRKAEALKDPFSGDNVPNSFVLFAMGLFGAIIISLILVLILGFFNYLFTSFFLRNTISLIKYCLGLIYWVVLSSLPIIGIFFICLLPLNSIEILNIMGIQPEINIWISFILFFLLSIGAYLFNTLSQVYLIREVYSDMQVKRKYQRYTIIVYVISIIIGIILIFTSDIIFSLLFDLIIQI